MEQYILIGRRGEGEGGEKEGRECGRGEGGRRKEVKSTHVCA